MAASNDPDKLRINLQKRLKSILGLYTSDLISRSTLSSQLLELIATKEAKSYWNISMKPDATARRMLSMLEDPIRWNEDSSCPEEERLEVFKERLIGIFLDSGESSKELLEMLLDTACLPHFESYAFTKNSKSSGRKSGAKLSVLD